MQKSINKVDHNALYEYSKYQLD